MSVSSGILVAAHAESARLVAAVYAMALVAVLPIAAAAAAAWMVRRATADARAVVWRGAIVALVVVIAGRQIPISWVAWVVPSFFAAPLVALGRVQVTSDSAQTAGLPHDGVTTDAGALALVLLVI